MNPHKLCWGFAQTLPLAFVMAITLLLSLLLSKEPKRIVWLPVNILLILFILWMTITTVFAFEPSEAWPLWDRMWRIQLITFITMIVIKSRLEIYRLIWVIVISMGFYGIKGGIFTVLNGGSTRVWGPEGSFIGGNNEIGLALCMIVPIMRYLLLVESKIRIKQGLVISILLSLLSILGTQSRGALLGMLSMIIFLILKSRKRFVLLLLMIISIPIIIGFMPDSWHERMGTINHYQKDSSAMGRINAWGAAINIAMDNLTGGGYKGLPIPWVFQKYAENPTDIHDAHSIYFQVLAEHGFPGLILFISIAVAAWRLASSLMKATNNKPDLQWIYDLSSMIQVSFIGYWSAGAFLGLADFDLYYCLIAILVCCKRYLTDCKDSEISLINERLPAIKPRQFIQPSYNS